MTGYVCSLELNNGFYNYQFGFRNNHSTNHALIEITKQSQNACDKIFSLAESTLIYRKHLIQ